MLRSKVTRRHRSSTVSNQPLATCSTFPTVHRAQLGWSACHCFSCRVFSSNRRMAKPSLRLLFCCQSFFSRPNHNCLAPCRNGKFKIESESWARRSGTVMSLKFTLDNRICPCESPTQGESAGHWTIPAKPAIPRAP